MYYLLFTTTRCPKCPAFKDFVQKFVKLPGKILSENDENFQALTLKFAISSVPTIMIFENEKLEKVILRSDDVTELYSFVNNSR